MKGEPLQGEDNGRRDNFSVPPASGGTSLAFSDGQSRLDPAVKIRLLTRDRNYSEAFALACFSVDSLGFRLPRKKVPIACWISRKWLDALNGRNWAINAIRATQCMDERVIETIRIVRAALEAAYHLAPGLAFRMAGWGARLLVRYGNTAEGISVQVFYGFLYQGGYCGDSRASLLTCELVSALSAREEFLLMRTEALYFSGIYGFSRKGAVLGLCNRFGEAISSVQKTDDKLYGAMARAGQVVVQWFEGVPLEQLWDSSTDALVELESSRFSEPLTIVRLVRQCVLGLQGKLCGHRLDGDGFDEGQLLGCLGGFQSRFLAQSGYLLLASYCIFTGRDTTARIHVHNSYENLGLSLGSILMAFHYFYDAMSVAFSPVAGGDRATLRRLVNRLSRKSFWFAPVFLVKLVKAEWYLADGQPGKSLEYYNESIGLASEAENKAVVALASSRSFTLPGSPVSRGEAMQAWEALGAMPPEHYFSFCK
jgi:hypothetical protein